MNNLTECSFIKYTECSSLFYEEVFPLFMLKLNSSILSVLYLNFPHNTKKLSRTILVEIFNSQKYMYWQWSCSVKVFAWMMIMTYIELHLCLIWHILISNFLIYLKSSSWEIAHVYHISYTILFLFLFSLLLPHVTRKIFFVRLRFCLNDDKIYENNRKKEVGKSFVDVLIWAMLSISPKMFDI
jgi:hypothetical protein